MSLSLILPWFPVVLAVGIAGRLLGTPRGTAVGVLCALFWVVLVRASEGQALWAGAWGVASVLAGAAAIVAVGVWAGRQTPELRKPDAEFEVPGPKVRSHDSDFIPALAEAFARLDDWLAERRDVGDGNLWPEFGEFVRTTLFQCVKATHVRPFAVCNEGQELTPLRQSDPFAADARLSAGEGIVGRVLASGRIYVAVAGRFDEPAPAHEGGPAVGRVAWCFPVMAGTQRLGVVTAGRLEIDPQTSGPLLDAAARFIGLCWNTVQQAQRTCLAVHQDPVTGLDTREAFLSAASDAMRAARSQGEPVAVAVVAVEGLRELNDSGRWKLADELLAAVGALLRRNVRTDDRVGRFDDSRFVLFLRRVDSDLAALIVKQVLERLSVRIEDENRWRARLAVRAGLAVASDADSDLTGLVSEALGRCTQARVGGTRLASNLPGPAAAGIASS